MYKYSMTFTKIFVTSADLPIQTRKEKCVFQMSHFQDTVECGLFSFNGKVFILHFYHIALLKKYNMCGQYQTKYGT